VAFANNWLLIRVLLPFPEPLRCEWIHRHRSPLGSTPTEFNTFAQEFFHARAHRLARSPIPTPDPAPITGGKGFGADKLNGLIKKAEDKESGGSIFLGYLLAAGDAVLGVGIAVGEHLLNATGVGMIVSGVRHGAAAHSTNKHLEALVGINYEKYTCKQCYHVVHYVIGKKSQKLVTRIAKAAPVPFIGGLITIGQKFKGIGKAILGSRGVHRKKFACVVWVAAREGCPTAKGIICELLGGKPEKLMAAVSDYLGILAIAKKMKST